MTNGASAAVSFAVFGTTATLIVTDPDALTAARRIADAELARIDLACSRFRADSELSRLNRAEGTPARVSEVFAEAIAVALRAARLTAGDVDPTCGRALVALGYDRDFAEIPAAGVRTADRPAPAPGWRRIEFDPAGRLVRLPPGVMLDLGATAKAWAADRCAARIAGDLGCGALISIGGDVAVAGHPPGQGWQVRTADNHSAAPDAPGQTVAVYSGGLATSSVSVRAWSVNGHPVHHILDPVSGEPARSCWRTVSVAAATCVDANTASTAAIIRDAAAPGWLESLRLPARLVRVDGSVVRTAGWPAGPGHTAGPGEASRRTAQIREIRG